MGNLIKKSIDKADEVRKFSLGHMDVVKLGDLVVGKGTFEPGWRWSECVRPIAGTPSCTVHHNGYIVSGRMVIRMDDGSETEVGPGDAVIIPPGHDAWTLGNEPCVMLDFSGAGGYAKK